MAKKKQAETPEISTVLTKQQQVAAHALAYTGYVKGKRVQKGAVRMAAEKAGVSRFAIYKWLNEIPEFLEEIERQTTEGIFAAWAGLMMGAQNGNPTACAEILRRLQPKEDPKVTLEILKHKHRREHGEWEHAHALELIERKAQLGMPLDDEPVTYNITIEEADMPPPPEERH